MISFTFSYRFDLFAPFFPFQQDFFSSHCFWVFSFHFFIPFLFLFLIFPILVCYFPFIGSFFFAGILLGNFLRITFTIQWGKSFIEIFWFSQYFRENMKHWKQNCRDIVFIKGFFLLSFSLSFLFFYFFLLETRTRLQLDLQDEGTVIVIFSLYSPSIFARGKF